MDWKHWEIRQGLAHRRVCRHNRLDCSSEKQHFDCYRCVAILGIKWLLLSAGRDSMFRALVRNLDILITLTRFFVLVDETSGAVITNAPYANQQAICFGWTSSMAVAISSSADATQQHIYSTQIQTSEPVVDAAQGSPGDVTASQEEFEKMVNKIPLRPSEMTSAADPIYDDSDEEQFWASVDKLNLPC